MIKERFLTSSGTTNNQMKRLLFFAFINFSFFAVSGQMPADSIVPAGVIVFKDPRIDMLSKKLAEYNTTVGANGSTGPSTGRGYRLMVISTNDRAFAMKVRSELYQFFPDQKQYMSYQLPNIKIKMGNYPDKEEAERARKMIISLKLVPNNIYLLPETVELKPEKKDPADKEKEK